MKYLTYLKTLFAKLMSMFASVKKFFIKPPVAVAPAPAQVPTPTPPAPPKPEYVAGTEQELNPVMANILGEHMSTTPQKPDDPVPVQGVRDTSPVWNAFDGHGSRQSFGPGSSVTFTVNVGKPFVFSLSECPGTDGSGTMTVTASDGSTITKHFGQAVDLEVKSGNVTIVATYDRHTTVDATIRQS